jgi:hypothetical protein
MRCLLLISLLLLAAAPAAAQHGFGAREQWQPQLAPADPRLDQPVAIELTGRAAVPVTEMLSEATGVSLAVAPEDLATVGERKLTIISNRLTLKTIMVQIPEALQECHWDIDTSGDEPTYLLHRNAGAGQTLERQQASRRQQATQTVQQLRAACLDDVRRALAMSPEQLAELEQTDLFLARAARHPDFRALMQSLLALPEDSMAELREAGHTTLNYADAPPEVQRAARLVLDQHRRWLEWVRSWPPEAERPPYWDEIDDWDARLADLEAQFESGEDLPIIYAHFGGREVGFGPIIFVGEESAVLLPARYTRSFIPGNYYHFLLAETGDDDKAAIATVEHLSKEWRELRDRRQWSEDDWVEPSDPRLHQQVSAPTTFVEGWGDRTDLSDLQQLIAERTGLSIISDYFTRGPIGLYPGQRPLGGPLWRDLYVLGQAGRFEWDLVGDCLVFHREDWYRLAHSELPESFIEKYRSKLEDQERFTLDDMAQLAFELEHRPHPPQPRFRGIGRFAIPRDLLDAGADAVSGPYRGMLLLYHALTPEERSAARTPDGLPLSQLPPSKQRAVADHVLPLGVPRASLQTSVPDFVAGTVFLVKASPADGNDGPPSQYELKLRYPPDPSLSDGDFTLTVRVAPPLPPSAPD